MAERRFLNQPYLDDAHALSELRECIARCANCQEVCASTIVYCLNERGDHAGTDLIRALVECTQACELARDLMLRGSSLDGDASRICAEVCERCAETCESVDGDEVLNRCAEECRRCAESCRAMAAGEPD